MTVTVPSIEFSIGTSPRSTSPRLDRGDHVRDRAQRHRLPRREIGLREQRLLRERAARPQIAHSRSVGLGRRVAHTSNRSGAPRDAIVRLRLCPRIVTSVQHWTLEEATTALPEVRATVQRIRRLVSEAQERAQAGGGDGAAASGNGHGPAVRGDDRELHALIATLTDRGIIVRDPARGLIDFPAQAPGGDTYLLCWLDGEDAIEWWHWPDAGFAGRTPLSEPPT